MKKSVAFPSKPAVAEKTADAWVSGGAVDAAPAPAETLPAVAKPTEEPAEPMKRLTIDIPASLHMRIKAQSAMRGAKMVDEIRALLEAHFAA